MVVGREIRSKKSRKLARLYLQVTTYFISVYHGFMGINWRYFWRSRSDLLILFVMLGSIFGLWSWGVKIDKTSEEKLAKESTAVYSEVLKISSETQGVMKALIGFYFGSSEVTSEELNKYLETLFDGQVWGGVKQIEVWQDGLRLEKIVFEEGSDLIYFEQVFFRDNKALTIKTAMDPAYLVNLVKKALSSEDELEIKINDLVVYATEKSVFRRRLESVKELEFGGVRMSIKLTMEDSPSETWGVFLGLGTVLSFVVYALVFSMTNSGRSAQLLAKEIVGDLAKYKKAINSLDSHLVITDVDGKVVFANPAVFTLTGYSEQEVLGQTPRLWGGQMSREFYTNMWDTIKNKKEVFKGEVQNKRKDGRFYTAYAVISPILDENGDLLGFVGSETDITERKQLEDEQKRMNELMVGRELTMVELKKKIAKLETEHV